MQSLNMKYYEPAIWRSLVNIVTVLLVFLALILLTSLATPKAYADEPAIFTGTMKCSEKFPGTRRDLATGKCWSCPSTHPNRTVFSVTSNKACEKPAHEVYQRALGPRNPTGLLNTDCQRGWFLDIGRGQCYSCPSNYNRSAHAVTHARACSRRIGVSRVSASILGADGCEPGSFQHGLTGRCYICPPGSNRNLRTGDDPSTFDACSAPADRARNPFTIYNRTDEPLTYSAALFDKDEHGTVEMLASGTIPPGERHPIDMAGNDCDPIKRGSTNAGVVFEGTRYDTCANKTFTVFLWNTEANLRDYQLVKGGIDFYATALGEYVGGLSGMATSEAAARYADWVFDQAYNEGGLLHGAGVRGLIFDIPQNDRWIAYWGRNVPTEIGATGDSLGDPRQLDNPCTRNAKMSLLGPEGETVLVNTNSFCGEAPAPGPG